MHAQKLGPVIVVLIALLALGASVALAAKPQDVIEHHIALLRELEQTGALDRLDRGLALQKVIFPATGTWPMFHDTKPQPHHSATRGALRVCMVRMHLAYRTLLYLARLRPGAARRKLECLLKRGTGVQ